MTHGPDIAVDNRQLPTTRWSDVAARLEHAVTTTESRGDVLRIAVAVPDLPVRPLEWLQQSSHDPSLYWCDRDSNDEVAGRGEVRRFDTDRFADLPRLTQARADGRETGLWLTARFDPRSECEPGWQPFGSVRTRLARVEFAIHESRAELSCQIDPHQARDAEWQQVETLLPDAAPPPGTAGSDWIREAESDRDAWRHAVHTVLSEITTADRPLRKAVLARWTDYRSPEPRRVARWLDRIPRTPAFRFLVQEGADAAFFGATPELLFRRRGATIESEALAGTRPRGPDAEADRRLADELMSSAKDLQEHAMVLDYVERELQPLCRQIEATRPPILRQLPYAQHLHSPVRGTLTEGVHDGTLLAHLHPTPAVGGLPAAEAQQWIRHTETFDRGLYAGVVGRLGVTRSDVAVAIRSARLAGEHLRIYAGAGIVTGSDADAEWDETEGKMRAFSSLLGSTR